MIWDVGTIGTWRNVKEKNHVAVLAIWSNALFVVWRIGPKGEVGAIC